MVDLLALCEAFVSLSTDSTLPVGNQTLIGRFMSLEAQSDECSELSRKPSVHRGTRHGRRSVVALSLDEDTGSMHQLIQTLIGHDLGLLKMLGLKHIGILYADGLVDPADIPWRGRFSEYRSIDEGFRVVATLDLQYGSSQVLDSILYIIASS